MKLNSASNSQDHNLEVSQKPSLPSLSSPEEIHARNEDKKGEDIPSGEGIYLHQVSIPSPKYPQNHVQNPNGEDSEGSEGICDTEGVQQGSLGQGQGQGNSYSFKCYHFGCDFQTNDQIDYERHGALKHLENPLLYPSRYELKRYGLTPQGKEWEV